MQFLDHRKRHVPRHRGAAAVVAAGALALSVAGYAAPAGAAANPKSADIVKSPQVPGSVSPTPVNGTPALIHDTGSTKDRIRQLVQCGNTMYAVGFFNEITQGGTNYTRNDVFSFDADAPYTITTWAPKVNGTVNSIAFNAGNCAEAYIGGNFSTIGSTKVHDIAEISTSTGDVDPSFGTETAGAQGGEVETLASVGDHILVGGYFKWINGTDTDPYFASVSPSTGKDDGFLHLNISGYYHYCDDSGQCTEGKTPYIYNQQLANQGAALDLVEGAFTSVGGLQREQIFMLNLATDPATVTGWTSPQFDGSDPNEPYQCYPSEAFYIKTAAWAYNNAAVYIGTTGFHPNNGPTGNAPRTGLCDAAAAFPATQASVTDLWINYTGCDSYYAVSADESTVYLAGHERYTENPNGCNFPGPGAIVDHGLQGLNPQTGDVELRPNGTPVYSMSRANADSMLITSAGLWIGSSNRYGSQYCGKVGGHSGICLLPYPSS
jgi:hypothetical protein